MDLLTTLQNLKDNDGLTLKKGEPITYKSGYQVAIEGVECATPQAAVQAIVSYNGNCGIWLSDGIYYIDKSQRIATKKAAIELGRAKHQISILGWQKMNLIYC